MVGGMVMLRRGRGLRRFSAGRVGAELGRARVVAASSDEEELGLSGGGGGGVTANVLYPPPVWGDVSSGDCADPRRSEGENVKAGSICDVVGADTEYACCLR